jgi:Putative ABC-transporter type IV
VPIPQIPHVLSRFLLYGLIGWCAEILWTAAWDGATGTRPAEHPGRRIPLSRRERLRLTGHTYLWMLPIYGGAALLFEPVHDAMRHLAWPLRGLLWTCAIFAVEAAAGLGLRRATGRCPWDYSYARLSVAGVIRLDYAPVWFAVGLGLERLHDLLLRVGPSLHGALAAP